VTTRRSDSRVGPRPIWGSDLSIDVVFIGERDGLPWWDERKGSIKMNWEESKAVSSIKRLVRSFRVTATDRREFVKRIARVARAVVPRRKRRSPQLEMVKNLRASV
jgi:hypothetical protein